MKDNKPFPGQSGEQLIAVQNELLIVRSELLSLQSARSVRAAKLLKQLLKARVNEWPGLIRSVPGLAKRYAPPRLEKLSKSYSSFSSVTNPLPLFRFPNVNVATIGDRALELFGYSCNTMPLGSESYKAIMAYDAIQVVAIDSAVYKPTDDEAIKEAMAIGAKLVYFLDDKNGDTGESFLKKFGDNTQVLRWRPSAPSAVQNHINIYHLDFHEVDLSGVTDLYTSPSVSVLKREGATSHYLGLESSPKIAAGGIVVLGEEDLMSFGDSPTESISQITTMIASGVPVIIKGKRPKWISREVAAFDNEKDIEEYISSLSGPYAAERYAVTCRQSTILQFNPLRCITKILMDIGLINQSYEPSISVLLATRRPGQLKHALEQLEKQTMPPSEVLVLLHGVSSVERKGAEDTANASPLNTRVQVYDKATLFGEVLNGGLDLATGEFTTKIDDDDYYAPNHILDLYVAFLHSQADIVGKWNNWVYLKTEGKVINWIPEVANSYVRHLPGGTLLGRTTVLQALRFGYVKRAIDSELYRRAIARGAILYSTHKYNYVRVRDDDHTYKTPDADFKSRAHSLVLNELNIKRDLSA